MRLALYRASAGNWVDRMIARLSGGPFSHVELLFNDRRCFSSTMRDASIHPATGKRKANGTRWKTIDFNPDHWEFVNLGTTPEQDAVIAAECDAMLDARYDFAGVFRFCVPIWRQHKDEYFCSEASVAACQAGFMFTGLTPWKETPNSLARRLGVF